MVKAGKIRSKVKYGPGCVCNGAETGRETDDLERSRDWNANSNLQHQKSK